MLSSLTPSTTKQYNGALRNWWIFCQEKSIDPYKLSNANVLSYLSKKFEDGAKQGTLNTHRSAIALLLGSEVGQDDLIKRLFGGVEKLRPNNPKYDEVWDPKLVLEFFNKKDDNNLLTLQELSYKTITLLCLATGHRIQTLSLIKLSNIQDRGNSLQIKITDRIKNSGKNRKQPLLILPFFEENCKICPTLAIKSYIDRTQNIRNSVNNLFISFRKPYKVVSKSTLSRWVKITLGKSGIDITKFSAHSTRHASTSTAYKKGVNIDAIRDRVGWTRESNIFANFYNLPIIENVENFARAVLND